MRYVVAVVLSLALLLIPSTHAKGVSLTDAEKEKADIITDEIEKGYEDYGCLPSICIAQGYVESHLGGKCRANNYWGLVGGRASYGSLREGVRAYQKVINNGYYDGAPFEKNPYTMIRAILAGGYCQPEGSYYSQVKWCISEFDLLRYDKKMFKSLRKKERRRRKRIAAKMRKRLQKNAFTFIYDESLANNEIQVNKSFIAGGVVRLGYTYLEVTGDRPGIGTIYTGEPLLDGMVLYLDEVIEDVVG